MSPLNRRDFLKLALASSLVSVLRWLPAQTAASVGGTAGQPNILVLVPDALSARHLALHGYPRQTTPNLDRFAAHATVYHQHYAAGNFTTSGAASLMTGVYPWTHRAFNTRGTVIPEFVNQNIFSLFNGSAYTRTAYSHNAYAELFLNQFSRSIEAHQPTESLLLANENLLDDLVRKDHNAALLSEELIFHREERRPASLFLSLAQQWRRHLMVDRITSQRSADFPFGLPMVGEDFGPYLLENATDWLIGELKQTAQPFFMYYHPLPPHEPYRPRADFAGLFDDGWEPVSKSRHYSSQDIPQAELNQRRLLYDRYIAFMDAELGRIFAALEAQGLFENTYVIVTSDHGQMFERGIHGHITPTLYHPLLHIPLLISAPGQAQRRDVQTLTSAVDLLPTLAHLLGQASPTWTEGVALPPWGPEPDPERSVFALEAKTSFKLQPLLAGAAALMRGPHKLIHTFGFRDHSDEYELYNLQLDPEEMGNFYSKEYPGIKSLRSELIRKIDKANQVYGG